MKLVMDEKLKHRLIGLAVIISLGAIFAPAVLKKSSQRLNGNFSVNVELPNKPKAPNVVIRDEKDLFKTIKIAKVVIPTVSDKKQLPELVKAQPIKADLLVHNNKSPLPHREVALPLKSVNLSQAVKNSAKKSIRVADIKVPKARSVIALKEKSKVNNKAKSEILAKAVQAVRVKPIARAPYRSSVKQSIYAVQLASFSKRGNAQSLVNQLRSKGYKAQLTQLPSQQGPVYKVHVGHSPSKNDALKLKSQLASAMRINGFVVNTGIS